MTEAPSTVPVAVPTLRLRGVGRRFGGLLAVSDVDLDVAHGERRAILGPNGAGKTTLFNVISGDLAASSGTVELFDEDVTTVPARKRTKRGLARTYQQSRMLLGLSVEDSIYLSALGVGAGHLRPVTLPKRDEALRERARAAAKRAAIDHKLSELVGNLSHGEHRQIAIAMALASEPKLLMLDEPASGLSRGERQLLTELLLALDPDITLVLIEHDMDVALTVAERVTMMHNGKVIVEGTPDEIRGNTLVHDLYLGRHHQPMSDVLLSVEGLQAHYSSAQVLHDVTFSMGKESVAIVGRNGMGKTTLCNAIMGFTPPRASGSVQFEGKELIGRPSHKIARAGLGYVPQGRRLFPSLTVHEHLVIAAKKGGELDCGPRLRVLPPARRTEAERRRRALRRRAADARDRPGAARQSAAPDHGRALRGARARDRRHDGRRVQEAGGGRSRDPADRAEARRGDVARRPPARDGRRRDRARDDRRRARARHRDAAAISRRRACGSRVRAVGPVLAIGTALLLAACGGSDDSDPDLLFVSTRDGDYAIYSMSASGDDQQRLTDTEVDPSTPQGLLFQTEPAWSPDGSTIAFASKRSGNSDLYAMDADGSGTRPLTKTKEDDAQPDWSPDGERIVFSRGSPTRLFVMNADGVRSSPPHRRGRRRDRARLVAGRQLDRLRAEGLPDRASASSGSCGPTARNDGS